VKVSAASMVVVVPATVVVGRPVVAGLLDATGSASEVEVPPSAAAQAAVRVRTRRKGRMRRLRILP
jgi:hypothetical protein